VLEGSSEKQQSQPIDSHFSSLRISPHHQALSQHHDALSQHHEALSQQIVPPQAAVEPLQFLHQPYVQSQSPYQQTPQLPTVVPSQPQHAAPQLHHTTPDQAMQYLPSQLLHYTQQQLNQPMSGGVFSNPFQAGGSWGAQTDQTNQSPLGDYEFQELLQQVAPQPDQQVLQGTSNFQCLPSSQHTQPLHLNGTQSYSSSSGAYDYNQGYSHQQKGFGCHDYTSKLF